MGPEPWRSAAPCCPNCGAWPFPAGATSGGQVIRHGNADTATGARRSISWKMLWCTGRSQNLPVSEELGEAVDLVGVAAVAVEHDLVRAESFELCDGLADLVGRGQHSGGQTLSPARELVVGGHRRASVVDDVRGAES